MQCHLDCLVAFVMCYRNLADSLVYLLPSVFESLLISLSGTFPSQSKFLFCCITDLDIVQGVFRAQTASSPVSIEDP